MTTYQFKVQIKGITQPPVWRTIVVPANFTFLRLHEVLQTAFGWCNYHLFEFESGGYACDMRIGIPSEDDFGFGAELMDASKVKLSKVFSGGIRKFHYVYDFGDSWDHEITLEAVSDEKRKEAFCLSGKGCCPPEDCGGVYGYTAMKNVFQTMPDSEEGDRYRDWLGLDKGETWDAGAFDIDGVNAKLREV